MASQGIKLLAFALLTFAAAHGAEDLAQGNTVDAMVRDMFPTVEDEAITSRLREVGAKVLEAAGNPHGYAFHFRVLNDATPNAFSTAAGYIYVNSGLLAILKSEDELAAVLAHEIAHINERDPMHMGISPRTGLLLSMGIYFASQFAAAGASTAYADAMGPQFDPSATANVSRQAAVVGQLASMAVSVISQKVLTQIYSGHREKKEFRADALAISYTRKAGYQPRALEDVLSRLLKSAGVETAGRAVVYLHSSRSKLLKRRLEIRNHAASPGKA
jgi:predicted Zn-dependent protease